MPETTEKTSCRHWILSIIFIELIDFYCLRTLFGHLLMLILHLHKGVQKKQREAPEEVDMDTRSKEDKGHKGSVELHCDSRKCYRCFSDGYCEERFEDLVFGVGP